MSEHAFRKGDRTMTSPYRPSNGFEGLGFIHYWCDRCRRDAKYRETHDAGDSCPILAATFAYEIDDQRYPPEWIVDVDDVNGATARCTAFAPETAT